MGDPRLVAFGWVEYLVFALTLAVSAATGVYFGFIKGGQKTVDQYLLGGKQMKVFPISMSMTSSFISGITILGVPTEIYTTGTQYFACVFCFLTVPTICIFVFLPVFYRLQAVSVYEYMERRFNKAVRRLVSFLYTASLLAYIPVVIYGPALALNQVSGLNIHLVSSVVCLVCIFYTCFGGLKAVVWSDTLQGLAMFLASVAVAVIGTINVGGLSAVLQANSDGDRLHLFDLDPDPRRRLTFWTVFLGQTVSWTAGSTISPSAIQRFVTLNSISKARKTVLIYNAGCFVLFVLSGYMGMVLYAKYQGCDPSASGAIKRADQILPFFILDSLGHITGLPGLFLAGVVCAALSTMSTGLNTVVGTLYEDFIEPIFGKKSELQASVTMKLMVVVFGGICLVLVMVIEKLGNLVELSVALGGLTSGSILGVFVLGLFFRPANSLGAMAGGAASLSLMSWILIGSMRATAAGLIVHPVKPISIDHCPFNVTNPPHMKPMVSESDAAAAGVFPLFQLSVFYFTSLGVTVTVLVGLLVSYATGPARDVDPALLTPAVRSLYRPLPLKTLRPPALIAEEKKKPDI